MELMSADKLNAKNYKKSCPFFTIESHGIARKKNQEKFLDLKKVNNYHQLIAASSNNWLESRER